MTNPLSPPYMDTKPNLYSPIRDSMSATRITGTIPMMSDYNNAIVAAEEEENDETEEAGPSTVSHSSTVSEETYKQLKRKMKAITEVHSGHICLQTNANKYNS